MTEPELGMLSHNQEQYRVMSSPERYAATPLASLAIADFLLKRVQPLGQGARGRHSAIEPVDAPDTMTFARRREA